MIQIELQPETEARYAAEAQVRGMALEQYLAEKLEAEAPRPAKKQMTTEERLADLEVFFKEMARYSDEIPILSDEAFTRESIYADHP